VTRWVVRVVGAVAVVLTAIATVFLLGMRVKSPLVMDRVRRFNRAVTNPRVLRSAGNARRVGIGSPSRRAGLGPHL
jgi:hypothetical protein